MDIFEQLRGNAVVEANNLTGLRNGHMVAQAAFDNSEAELEKLENGVILQLDAKNELVLATGNANAFLHYSEEHMKFLDSASLDMFNVPLDKTNKVKSYPRAIALYEGDTFTTDNVAATGAIPAGAYADVTVVNGKLTIADGTAAAEGTGPIAKNATLPNGTAAFEIVWRGGNA